MLWAVIIYLALELVPALIAKEVLNKTVQELLGPYLAFAIPGVIFLPLTWWLRNWEKSVASPRWLALGWCLSMTLFISVFTAAVFYSGGELHLINSRDDVMYFVVAGVVGALAASFGMYNNVLARITERAARNKD
jgi:hypothetical protein